MPIFFQQDIDAQTRLGIWKIGEVETFFLEKVVLQRSIIHPHKRLQHLAGRYLLPYLMPGFPMDLIRIADTRKPFLEDEAYHFSISHCGDYAAVIVSSEKRVGIDIELVSPKVEKVRHKFLTAEEWELTKASWEDHTENTNESEEVQKRGAGDLDVLPQIQNSSLLDLSTLLWCSKEAVFKWYGDGEVDFRDHIRIAQVEGDPGSFRVQVDFLKHTAHRLQLRARFFNQLCLSYVVTEPVRI